MDRDKPSAPRKESSFYMWTYLLQMPTKQERFKDDTNASAWPTAKVKMSEDAVGSFDSTSAKRRLQR